MIHCIIRHFLVYLCRFNECELILEEQVIRHVPRNLSYDRCVSSQTSKYWSTIYLPVGKNTYYTTLCQSNYVRLTVSLRKHTTPPVFYFWLSSQMRYIGPILLVHPTLTNVQNSAQIIKTLQLLHP